MRFDANKASPGSPYSLIDRKANKIYTVVDGQKLIMVADASAPAQTAAEPTKYKIDKTGKTDTVAGQACELWNVSDDASLAELCVVHGLEPMPTAQMSGVAPNMRWSLALESEAVFPLRAVVRDAAAKEMVNLEATRIERAPVDDARFVLPTDYKTMNQVTGPGIPGVGRLAPRRRSPGGGP